MNKERETRLLMLSPSSRITPNQLYCTIHAMKAEISVKETCYGCLIEGPSELVRKIRDEVKKLNPNEIFSKIRAYPIGDPKRCRAQHGSRPGFSQLETEWKALSYVEAGLNAIDKGEQVPELPRKKQISVAEFQRICEVD
ncbi:MAG: methanogenesis marker protein 6 [archaeon]|nr:methanogenesis marker protein 6 [archaeon]